LKEEIAIYKGELMENKSKKHKEKLELFKTHYSKEHAEALLFMYMRRTTKLYSLAFMQFRATLEHTDIEEAKTMFK
jgi:hypothetical protein